MRRGELRKQQEIDVADSGGKTPREMQIEMELKALDRQAAILSRNNPSWHGLLQTERERAVKRDDELHAQLSPMMPGPPLPSLAFQSLPSQTSQKSSKSSASSEEGAMSMVVQNESGNALEHSPALGGAVVDASPPTATPPQVPFPLDCCRVLFSLSFHLFFLFVLNALPRFSFSRSQFSHER